MMLSLIKERGLHPFAIRQTAMQVLSRLCHGCPANQQAVGELQVCVAPDALQFFSHVYATDAPPTSKQSASSRRASIFFFVLLCLLALLV
jgi:hypothetical protein